jgi:4-amino-4-deoxychorismate lyase
LQTLGWCTADDTRLRQGAELILRHYPVLRITIFPDGREWITGRLLPSNLTVKQTNGIIAAISDIQFQRSLPNHKTGNYLSPWLALNRAQKLDAQEAILVSNNGNWLETSTGNLWGWYLGNWWTPPLEAGILPGVMRSQIINWLDMQQVVVKQEPWTLEVVKRFEAIAYTNSVVEIIPIHTVIQPTGNSEAKLEYNPHHPGFEQLRKLFLA